MGDNSIKDVSAKAAVDCIRSDMSNAEVMKRFQINTKGYVDLLRQLVLAKLITEEDLTRRGIRVRIISATQQAAVTQPIKPQQVVAVAPVMTSDEQEGFLDTAALVDLLAGNAPSARRNKKSIDPEPEEEIKEESVTDSTPSKSRFSLTGLFKKSK